MEKIPTVFARSEDRRHVIDQVTPGCEWVLVGEGRATRKWDGTCVMFDGDWWWARREVKPGKGEPDGFVSVGHDDITGKTIGWEPAEQSGFYKYLVEAAKTGGDIRNWQPGTFELCGPKINGNPEGLPEHAILRHGSATVTVHPAFLELQCFLQDDYPHLEGIVWWHPDGRKAKIKRRDFK